MSSEHPESIHLQFDQHSGWMQRQKITDVEKIKHDALEIHTAVFPNIPVVSVSLEIPGFVKISNDHATIMMPLESIDSVLAFERGEK